MSFQVAHKIPTPPQRDAYLEKCVNKMAEDSVVAAYHVAGVWETLDRGYKVQLRGDKALTFQDLDKVSVLFSTKEIDVEADTDGSGCGSCGYYGEGVVVLNIYKAAIHTTGVEPDPPPPPPKKVKGVKPPKPPKPVKRAKGSYIIVAQTEAHAKDWCMGKNFLPGQAVLCDDECESAVGLDRKKFKIVTVGARTAAPFTRDLVIRLQKMGFKKYRGFGRI
jgi:hypothetical protein